MKEDFYNKEYKTRICPEIRAMIQKRIEKRILDRVIKTLEYMGNNDRRKTDL